MPFNPFFSASDNEKILISDTALKAAEKADAIIIITEWEEFKDLDWSEIYNVMSKPAWIFDTRILIDKNYLNNIGFKVLSLGNS